MGVYTPHEETYSDGATIVNEGDGTREMYIIQSGSVVVSRVINGREVQLAVLERGDFFGEMSLLESEPRSATIRANGETKLLVVKPGSLLLKIRRNPTFALEMLQALSRRVRVLNGQLKELCQDEGLAGEVSARLEAIRQHALEDFRNDDAR